MNRNVLPTYIYIYMIICVPGACHSHKKAPNSPGTGVVDDSEPPRGYWELISDPLQEQPRLLTAEPSAPQWKDSYTHRKWS